MKRRYVAIGLGAIGTGIALSYVAVRYADKALETMMSSLPYVASVDIKSEKELLTRNFVFPTIAPQRLAHDADHPLDAVTDRYRSLRVKLDSKAISQTAACELVGTKTGLVGLAEKSAQVHWLKRPANPEVVWPSSVFYFSEDVRSALWAACPIMALSSSGSLLSHFKGQQQYLVRAAVQRYAPPTDGLRMVVKKACAAFD